MPNKLPPLPNGAVPGSYFWNDWYEKVRTLVNSFLDGVSWSLITGTPTTVAGYGITDAVKTSDNISVLAASTSAQLRGLLTDETGTGAAVFANTPTLVTPAIGAATGTSIVLTGDITTGTGTLHKTTVNLTNGAAAALGTLANAPVAGNPTKWIPVDDNGTIRYIPAW